MSAVKKPSNESKKSTHDYYARTYQVVVLDYTTQLTHVFTYPEGTEDIENWVEDTHGINMNNAHYMA